MPEHITPEQCEELGMVTRGYSRWFCRDVPLVVRWRGEHVVLIVGSHCVLCDPTVENVRRLMSALRGEATAEERALRLQRYLLEQRGIVVTLLIDDSVTPRPMWCAICRDNGAMEFDDRPDVAIESVMEELGVELPEYLMGGE